ncbi:DUF2283 domain-containing protein [Aerophototrophica crusticola]|uniref:DUF2283 domain-containing protein n=1 Tax=Aerophototrophica crusticola TaxID=1709002 RepID=A0A858R4D4_9PROT|nr:DUF2283 domain-containing protein [Rhodospirillaceae bacterium B3]
MTDNAALSYDPAADMLRVELRPWPAPRAGDDPASVGGEEQEPDLVVHFATDGKPWAWEIEHASRRPDLVARALAALRASHGLKDAA